jgi:excisionase family DNA binding protein
MTKDLEDLCTIKQACFSEKAGRTTIYNRIKEGHYKAYKIGGSTRLSLASVREYRRQLGAKIVVAAPPQAATMDKEPGSATCVFQEGSQQTRKISVSTDKFAEQGHE